MHTSNFHIRSAKFPVLQEDRDECCNPGTYGKSLVDYIQTHLESRGYEIPFTVAEDFGWWIEIKTPLQAPTHVIVRRSHEDSGVADYGIVVDDSPRKWSWRRFRFVNLDRFQEKLSEELQQLFTSDSEIDFIATHFEGYPDRLNANQS